ncbi:SpaA isopeptide-forming pilin-related protein [Streptomyces sp. NPDC051567]|uniref:SpaA isopeptide-forming pilin-related protein n=1 Tax=Streptomyces sp. NPDC051567 TaxID=3365660 RepID=UPI00378F721C
MSARKWTLGLTIGAVLAAGAPMATAAGPGGDRPAETVRVRAPLPGGLGPCIPGTCPDPFPEISVGNTPKGIDQAVNVFVGGNFLVRERAAEAEGKVVVLGNFDQDKSVGGSSAYNIGIVGAGSLVQPPVGSDFLTTGGNVNIAADERLLAEGGVVRYAGTAPGAGQVTGTLTHDPAAAVPFEGLRDQLSAASKCYARVDGQPRPATGTAVNSFGTTTFTGDNTSALQVFNVDFNLVGNTGGMIGIRFEQIPANATVLVNVLGTTRTINTFSGTIVDSQDPFFNKYRSQLLWNFPDATTVNLNGSGQFQGSVLVGEEASQTTVTLPGMNGRFFTTGTLTHTGIPGGGGGQEFHAYPFNGDLPDCATPPVTGNVTVVKQDESGNPLAGAAFDLWHETNGVTGLQTTGANPDTVVAECTTGADGRCTQNTVPGTYYWRETAAPPGYVLPSNPVSTLVLTNANASVGVQVQVPNAKVPPPAEAKVVLTKTDKDSNVPLPGATFQLWRESNGVAGLQTTGANPDTLLPDTCVTDAAGTCTATLPIGSSYYWLETGVPAGYDPSANPVTPFALDEGDVAAGIVLDIPNTKTPVPPSNARVVLIKTDKDSNVPLPGATFQLWRESNGVAGLQTTGANPDTLLPDTCVTNVAGTCTVTLPIGSSYYWLETGVPVGYEPSANPVTPFVLDEGDVATGIVLDIPNTKTPVPPVNAKVVLIKTDKDSNVPLAGATFQLWRESNGVAGLQTTGANPDTLLPNTCVTNAAGTCTATLPIGSSYYWLETGVPAGYEPSANPVTPFTLDQGDVATGIVLDIPNTKIPVPPTDAKVVLTKTDKDSNVPLPGATFQLWRESNGVAGLQTTGPNPDTLLPNTCVTDAVGTCTVTLPIGSSYYWLETGVPAGYEPSANPVTPFLLDQGDVATGIVLNVPNTKTPAEFDGKIRVEKKDAKTKRPLRGAVFEVWEETNGIPGLQTRGINPDHKARPGCATDGAGICAFGGLSEGSYYLLETAVPEGYVLPPNRVTGPLLLNEQTPDQQISVTLENKRDDHGKGKGKEGHGHRP